jgi:predicted MPP superfamily phosphohydrolase
VVFGDNRSKGGDHVNHEALIPAIRKETPDFVINTGDMVDLGLSSPMWDRFFEIERELLREVPLWPTFGNHEQGDFTNLTYLKIFSLPPHADDQEHRYYEFRHSNCHFIVTNTHDAIYGTHYGQATARFHRDQPGQRC